MCFSLGFEILINLCQYWQTRLIFVLNAIPNCVQTMPLTLIILQARDLITQEDCAVLILSLVCCSHTQTLGTCYFIKVFLYLCEVQGYWQYWIWRSTVTVTGGWLVRDWRFKYFTGNWRIHVLISLNRETHCFVYFMKLYEDKIVMGRTIYLHFYWRINVESQFNCDFNINSSKTHHMQCQVFHHLLLRLRWNTDFILGKRLNKLLYAHSVLLKL